MANHMASRSRSRSGNRREEPVQQAQQAVVQQAGVQVQHVDAARLVVGGLPRSRRLRGCMSRAVRATANKQHTQTKTNQTTQPRQEAIAKS